MVSLSVIGMLVFGCGRDAEDTAATPCAPYSLELAQSWDEATLPQRSSISKGSPGMAIGDFTGDDIPDVLLAYGGGSVLMRGDGTGQLAPEEAATLDGAPLPRARAAAAADVDGDGDLDAFLGMYDEGDLDLLLINDGTGRFTSSPLPDSGYVPWGASFGDLNGDGRLDLYIATYNAPLDTSDLMTGKWQGAGHGVYLQSEDGAFLRQDSAIPAEADGAISLQGALLDADDDGDLDVYMVNDFGPFVVENKLLLNDGTGHFTVAEDCSCDLAMYGMGAAVGDGDDDGDPDLFITNVGSPRYLINLGDGVFADATAAAGADIPPEPENMTSWGAAFLDADSDGCMDLAVSYGGLQSEGALILEHESGGAWTEVPEQDDLLLMSDCSGGFSRADRSVFADTGRGRALAVGDLNGDGRPDLVTAGKHYMNVWLAEGGCEPGIRVSLDAGADNRHGIGAKVSVDLGERTVTQWMLPSATASSSEHALYFGLGGRAAAEQVPGTWPDGHTEQHEAIVAGTRLHLSR